MKLPDRPIPIPGFPGCEMLFLVLIGLTLFLAAGLCLILVYV